MALSSLFLLLVVAALAVSTLGFMPSSSKFMTLSRQSAIKPLQMADGETDDEIRDRIRKKMRKNMYNEQGVAFAPWVVKQINEEAIVEDLFRKEKEGVTKPKKGSILDRGEIESSEGMKWRMNNNLVDLAWSTSSEPDNLGYIVEKRPSYGGDFQEIASFKEVPQLASKGVSGGRYRYTDPSTAGGSWIYRVRDCESNEAGNVLCQCFVEVQTDSESKFQSGAVVGIIGVLTSFLALGYFLDPPK